MKTEWKLPKKTLIVWRLRLFLFTIILCAFLGIFFSLYVFSAVLLLLCFAFSLIFLPFLIKSYVITVTDAYISVEKGIIIKKTQIMPRKNLVYAESLSLPLSNALGLSAVILKAAKGYCVILEIEKEKADILISSTKGEKDG